MRRSSNIVAGPLAVLLMIFYFFLSFLVVAGAPDFLVKVWPLLISGSVLLIAAGLFRAWNARHTGAYSSQVALRVLWCSALTVFGLILFSQIISNFLASLVR